MNTPKTTHYSCCFNLISYPGPLSGFFVLAKLFYSCYVASKWNNLINHLIASVLRWVLSPLELQMGTNFVPKSRNMGSKQGVEGTKTVAMGTVYNTIGKLPDGQIVKLNTFAP